MGASVRTVCLLAASLACSLLAAAPARATCVLPPPTILWSSPGQNATDVPLDADLLLIVEGWQPDLRVTVDGRVLNESELRGVYDLGRLEPSREYVVGIDRRGGGTGVDGTPIEPVVLRFTTGTGTAQGPADTEPFTITAIDERIADYDIDCSSFLYANSCYDTGPPVLQTFDVDHDTEALLWVIHTTAEGQVGVSTQAVLPVECGSPQQLTGRTGDGDRTYVIHAVHADGSTVSSHALTRRFRAVNLPQRWDMSMEEGCMVAAPGQRAARPGLQAALLLLGIAMAARARRSRS